MIFKCRIEKEYSTRPKGSNIDDSLTQISQCCAATKAASVVPSGLRSPRPQTCSAVATRTGTAPACGEAAVAEVAAVAVVAVAKRLRAA